MQWEGANAMTLLFSCLQSPAYTSHSQTQVDAEDKVAHECGLRRSASGHRTQSGEERISSTSLPLPLTSHLIQMKTSYPQHQDMQSPTSY